MTDEEFDEEFNEEFDEEFDEDFVEDYDGEFDEEFDEKRNEKIEKFYELKEKAYPVRPYQVFGLDAFCGQAARTANRHQRSKAHSEYLADLRINANLAIQRKYDIVTPKSLIEDSGLIKEERIDGIFSEYGEHREWPSKQHQDIAVGMLKTSSCYFRTNGLRTPALRTKPHQANQIRRFTLTLCVGTQRLTSTSTRSTTILATRATPL